MAGASEVAVSNEKSTIVEDGAIRLSKLRSALNRTAEACVSTIGYALFVTHFNPKSRDEKEMLRGIHKEFREKALELVKDEIVLMIREENVEQMLLKLDELCKLSSCNEVHWRPKGVPADDATAQSLAVLAVLRKKLKSLLDETEAETDRMMHAVLERRRIIHSLKTEIAKNAKLLRQDDGKINDYDAFFTANENVEVSGFLKKDPQINNGMNGQNESGTSQHCDGDAS